MKKITFILIITCLVFTVTLSYATPISDLIDKLIKRTISDDYKGILSLRLRQKLEQELTKRQARRAILQTKRQIEDTKRKMSAFKASVDIELRSLDAAVKEDQRQLKNEVQNGNKDFERNMRNVELKNQDLKRKIALNNRARR